MEIFKITMMASELANSAVSHALAKETIQEAIMRSPDADTLLIQQSYTIMNIVALFNKEKESGELERKLHSPLTGYKMVPLSDLDEVL
jgi:hypothetical protein